MNRKIISPSLGVAMEANAAAYGRMVRTSAPGDCWDFVILTAANERQAHGYREELALRHRSIGPAGAFFPAMQKSFVIADPPGRRAGSGGATLAVLPALAEQNNLTLSDFRRYRILLIHSGGAGRRLPAYAPVGKIFAPLPLLRPDGQISTLFDHLYTTLSGLPARLGPGMLVVAGDVLLMFDHRHVLTPEEGVTALSMSVEAEIGTHHGVFIADEYGQVKTTLQKASVPMMASRGAIDSHGHVLIDTGMLFFDSPRTELLASLAGCSNLNIDPAAPAMREPNILRAGAGATDSTRGLQERYEAQLDLYEDITGAMASATPRDEFLATHSDRGMLMELWDALHGIPLRVINLDGHFLHLGTTRQFRDVMNGTHSSPAVELLQQNVLAYSEWPLENSPRIYHSVLLQNNGETGWLGRNSVVEYSVLGGKCSIGNGSVVSQFAAIDNPVELGDNLLLFQVPLRCVGEYLCYVTVVCGVDDDFKGSVDAAECSFLNSAISLWLERQNIAETELWPDETLSERTLWNARLFALSPSPEDFHIALALSKATKASSDVIKAWRQAPRYSMAMILEQADPVVIIEQREKLLAYLQGSQLLESIQNNEDRHIESLVTHYSTSAGYTACQELLHDWAKRRSADARTSLQQARALWSVVQLLHRPDHPDPTNARRQVQGFIDGSFGKIAEATELGYSTVAATSEHRCVLTPGTEITAAAPVRLDLAGGWTDTPPYCFERGGHVINLAVNLDGRPPIQVMVSTLSEPRLLLESRDLGQRVDLASIHSFPVMPELGDPFSIHKVALRMVGLLPDEHPDVMGHLRTLGAGVSVVSESRVPRGSGLGASSILGATLLAALNRLVGRELSFVELMEQTLLLEQRLGAGGGWQDQVGGIAGGVKSIMTAPGAPQLPTQEPLALSDRQYDALQERLVVYYTGQQRLARDILQKVVGRWLSREPSAIQLMVELKQCAATLPRALTGGRWTEAGRIISHYWELKKQLFPNSTTPQIDILFLELSGHYLAAAVAGAGGGGFAYFLCKSARQASQLRALLIERSSRHGSPGGLYQVEINRAGLVVTDGHESQPN